MVTLLPATERRMSTQQNLSSLIKNKSQGKPYVSSKPKPIPQQPTQNSRLQQRNSERVSHLVKIFRPNKPVKSLLDIGCGNAEITREIADTFNISDVHGADVYAV